MKIQTRQGWISVMAVRTILVIICGVGGALTRHTQQTGPLSGIDTVLGACRRHRARAWVRRCSESNRGVVKRSLDLFCRCSSSVLRKIMEISSASTSFFFPSFRKPETFCPFSTVTSKISSQGRTHRLERTSRNDRKGVNASVGYLGDRKGKAVAVTHMDKHTPVP